MGSAGVAAMDPVLWLVAGSAAATLVIMLALRGAARRKEQSDPLTSLFDRARFEERMDETAELSAEAAADVAAPRLRKTAVLSGRLDHLVQVGKVWGQDARKDAILQVAQVMRAGVRKTDLFADDSDEGFTIVAEGASESEAGDIAKRLMERLAEMPVPGAADDVRLTASIGVAERREGESDDDVRARADAARETAQADGEDRIVTASDWEEIPLLPAPALTGSDESAAA